MTDRAARCETCCYYDEKQSRCHAQPPQVDQESDDSWGRWPMVYGFDWCGHYRPNAEATRALVEAGT